MPLSPLLHLSATELARRIRHRQLTSRQVVDAHIERAMQVGPSINAIVAERYESARQEADAADRRTVRSEPEELPPFHGVPCTIKECFELEGMPQTAGLLARRGVCSAGDATTVARLRAAGAIPLGVTNTSELCMWMETDNPVYGRTRNPYDTRRIVGGSSGGEGAIVGSGASPFGLGSDVGGSIRMPAFFNGVFGHKPSGGAVPSSGQHPPAHGRVWRYLTTGPLCRRAEDLMPLMHVLAGPDGIDPGTEAMTWPATDTLRIRDLTVYTVESNGLRSVDSQLLGAQRRAARALESAGARIVPTRLPDLRRSLFIWSAGLQENDNGPSFGEMLGQGQAIPVWKELGRWLTRRSQHTLPALGLALFETLPMFSGPDPRALEWAESLRATLRDLLEPGAVLLYPSFTRPAPFHRAPWLTPIDFTYTAIFNVMELPVTQVPLGLTARGVPTGVQVAGAWGQDHRTIAVAEFLERALGGWVPPQGASRWAV
jgi:fatty acid amide hydrolase 2